MRPAGHCFIYHSIYVNVSYMNNEISAKSGKSMESDPSDLTPLIFGDQRSSSVDGKKRNL